MAGSRRAGHVVDTLLMPRANDFRPSSHVEERFGIGEDLRPVRRNDEPIRQEICVFAFVVSVGNVFFTTCEVAIDSR